MASQRQIDANRRNARKSTGPRTTGGKETSRENALKHGLASRRTILPVEDAAEFHQLRAELIGSWNPVGKQELLLVDHIAFSHWRMLRGRAAEFGIFNLEIEGSKKRAGIAPEDHSRDWEALGVGLVVEEKGSFDNFFRYEAAAERLFFRSTEQLRKLQAARFKREESQSGQLAPLAPEPMQLASAVGSPTFTEVFVAAAAASTAGAAAHISAPLISEPAMSEALDIPESIPVSEIGIGFVAQNSELPAQAATLASDAPITTNAHSGNTAAAGRPAIAPESTSFVSACPDASPELVVAKGGAGDEDTPPA